MRRGLLTITTFVVVWSCVQSITWYDGPVYAMSGQQSAAGDSSGNSQSSLLKGLLGGNSNLAGGSTATQPAGNTNKANANKNASKGKSGKKGKSKNGSSNSLLGSLLNSKTNFTGSGSPSGAGSGSKKHKNKNTNQQKKQKSKKPATSYPPIAGSPNTGYSAMLTGWAHAGIQAAMQDQVSVPPSAFYAGSRPVPLVSLSKNHGNPERVFDWTDQYPYIEFHVNVKNAGLYAMKFHYYINSNNLIPIERGILINGNYQYLQSKNVEFQKAWKNASAQFPKDAFGNELPQNEVQIPRWDTEYAMDHTFLHDQPLLFYFHQGDNTVRINRVSDSMLFGNVDIVARTTPPSYSLYQNAHLHAAASSQLLLTYQAEQPFVRSDPAIQAQPNGDPGVVPYRAGLVTLNTLGGNSWQNGGQSVTWKISVPNSGNYQLAFKYEQNILLGLPVYRTLAIDGQVPFEQMLQVSFPYSTGWQNQVIGNATGKPYEFYLTKGTHLLTLTANPAPYRSVIRTIQKVLTGADQLSLEIRMVTGNTLDQNRTWDIVAIIPNLVSRLDLYANELKSAYKKLEGLSGTAPAQAQNLMIAADDLTSLAKSPEQVPYRFQELSQGASSVNEMLGELLTTLPQQPLLLDQFYVYHHAALPSPTAGFWQTIVANVESFFRSFTTNYSLVGKSTAGSLKIWVNRPREYVALMQQMANDTFTRQTGIKVTMMIMPNEQKLILANAAGQTPDIALGVNNATPFNMGVRGAMLNLKQMPGFQKVIRRFSPGALLPFEFNNQYYAIPETQDFWVLFYRKDILKALHLPVPQTWNQVIAMLPVLQRYGMNFYDPIAGAGGYKTFATTLPFIYQAGGELFYKNGLNTAIDSNKAINGFNLMTNLFTTYGLPQQVPNFYTHFVQGDMPIGVADFNTYVQLVSAAPQINGLWGITPMPGIRNHGQIVRYAPGTGEADMIFKSSKKQLQSWSFLKWWTSSKTQVNFANQLETLYGTSYLWNTSNLNAFRQLPWPQSDIHAILAQWKWMRDVPHVPGDYMVEREISNAWNSVVFSGVNQRQAIQDAAITADREIHVQLEQLGYINVDGKVLKPITMPIFSKERG